LACSRSTQNQAEHWPTFKDDLFASISALAEISGQSFMPALSEQRQVWRGWDRHCIIFQLDFLPSNRVISLLV
jgi:hypothetical protein